MYGFQIYNSGGKIQITGEEMSLPIRETGSKTVFYLSEYGNVYGNVVEFPASIFVNGSMLFMSPPNGNGNIRYIAMYPFVDNKVRIQTSTVGTHTYVLTQADSSAGPTTWYGLKVLNSNGLGLAFNSNESYLVITQQISIPFSASSPSFSGAVNISTSPYINKLPYFSVPSVYGVRLYAGYGDAFYTFIFNASVSNGVLSYTVTKSGPENYPSIVGRDPNHVFQINVGVLT